LSTGKKKIKIELEDDDGGKYNLSLEGNLSKDKIQKVLHLVESLNISKEELNTMNKSIPGSNNITSKDIDKNNHSLNSIESKIWALIENNFAFSSFTSSDVAESYESLYQEQLQLSLISTYLSRYFDKKKLIRSKRGKEWIYKLIRIKKDITSNLNSQDNESQSTHLLNSHYSSSENQNNDYFLKQNVLSTVYDLRL
jgi:predicted transcriptional regulator